MQFGEILLTVFVISSNSCEYKWKCKSNDGWTDATCSMSYTPDKKTIVSIGSKWQYKIIKYNYTWALSWLCKNVGDDVANLWTLYDSQEACYNIIYSKTNGVYDYYRNENTFGTCTTIGAPCAACLWYTSFTIPIPIIQEETWSCVVDSVSYPTDDWRCSWIAPSCPDPSPRCLTVCQSYKKELTNQYGCSVSTSDISDRVYDDYDTCLDATKTFRGVRSQSSTSWNKWDRCNIDPDDPDCVPCVSCSCVQWATQTVCK